MDPETFTGGPAYATWDGLTLEMHDDWSVVDGREFFDIRSNLQGYLDSGVKDLMVKVRCRPIAVGGSISTLFTKLFPYTSHKQGQLIFTDTAKPMVIQTSRGGTGDAGLSITLANVRVFKSPDLNFDPDKPFLDEMEFVALVAPDADAGDASSFITVADSTYSEPNSLVPANILYDVSALAWGAAPFDAIEVGEGGIKFSADWSLQARKRKTLTYNYSVNAPTATVAFQPENIDLADFYETLAPFEGAGAKLGAAQTAHARTLTITGSESGKPLLTIPYAFCERAGGARFAGSGPATEGVTMRAIRRASSTLAAATTNTDATVTVASTATLRVGLGVSGTGIPGGATIASITNATTFELSAAATATGTPTLTFTGLHPLFTLGTVA